MGDKISRFQIVWWRSPREWSFGHWRWPEERFPNWPRYGFHGLCLGPIEFRYWPQPVPPTATADGDRPA